ncbi:hypothetical protein CANCADRAFT_82607 [Tortispora caseinolytica NRRL Y-17796]|uniref:Proteasome subunit beta n=1 Tax=Tortispora caseinolytica NRRL Y-17796 TaxID=767744 RepID=A0A1E4TK31_9ASCO|nr:hypothetical protein CANCADRAFT_82607 [Tortispora caseinolytica NRRL Y-17796]
MELGPHNWGRPRDDVYGSYNAAAGGCKMNTQSPIMTGTSVIATKFKGGIVMAADNLASYGSLARFRDQERIVKVGERTVVGISGDISDLQYVERLLDQLVVDTSYDCEGTEIANLEPANVYEHLAYVLYGRRNKMNPLWVACVVGGVDSKGECFLGQVDLLGVKYKSPSIATGFGAHMAVPLLRRLIPDEDRFEEIDEKSAVDAIDECMKVLVYRDARALDKYTRVVVTSEGVKITKGVQCEKMNWEFAETIKGYGY